MSTPGTRTLQLLSLLQSRRYWTGAALADRMAVSDRTLRRDVDRLRELGYPVEARRGVDGGYQLAAGAVLPPLVLDDEEAVAIGVGLHSAIQAGTVTGIEESSVRALSKVVHVMPPALRRRIDALAAMTVPAPWGGGPSVDANVLVALAQACRDGDRLEFDYTAHGGDESVRHVDPHRLVLLGRRWYVVAYDLDRFDWRTFRLDRVGAPGPPVLARHCGSCPPRTPLRSCVRVSSTCRRGTRWWCTSMRPRRWSGRGSVPGEHSRIWITVAAASA